MVGLLSDQFVRIGQHRLHVLQLGAQAEILDAPQELLHNLIVDSARSCFVVQILALFVHVRSHCRCFWSQGLGRGIFGSDYRV